MRLADLLFSQGFGTRRVCAGLIEQGLVEIIDNGQSRLAVIDDDLMSPGLNFKVQGQPWQFYERAYVMLHKPAGFECSQKPSMWPSIYTLLPAPLRTRPGPTSTLGVQAIGRLDQDTTGLLLLSDDGQFIHRLSSPKKHVAKIYHVTCKHPVSPAQINQLLEGVVLDDSPKPVAAAKCHHLDHQETVIALTLTEGKYHQVKRMLAAVSNRVEALHRAQIGALTLADLPSGQWTFINPADIE
jgi:16S rRNA pseudouridine516 synthase